MSSEDIFERAMLMAHIAGVFQPCTVAKIVPALKTNSRFVPLIGGHIEVCELPKSRLHEPHLFIKHPHELSPIAICWHIACNVLGFKALSEYVFELKHNDIVIVLENQGGEWILRVWPDKFYSSHDFEVQYIHNVQSILSSKYGITLTPIKP